MIIFSLFLFSFAGYTQELDTVRIPKNTVTGKTGKDLDLQKQFNTPEAVSIIRPEDHPQALHVSDLIKNISGLQVRRYGGFGSYSTVSIRGIKGQQVRVYLDGIPLNSSAGQAVNLGTIPLHEIDRVEIYKGNIPARFGGSGAGGVVYIVSRKNKRALVSAGLQGGSYQMISGNGTAQAYTNRGSGKFSADYKQAENDFLYLDRNGTVYNTTDDKWKKRSNAQYKSYGVSAQGRFLNRVLFNLHHRHSTAGIPGRENQATKSASHETPMEIRGEAGVRDISFFRDQVTADFLLPGTYDKQTTFYPDSELANNTGDTTHVQYTAYSIHPSARFRWNLLDNGGISFFCRGGYENIASEDLTEKSVYLILPCSRKSIFTALEWKQEYKQVYYYLTGGQEVNFDHFYGGDRVRSMHDSLKAKYLRNTYPVARGGLRYSVLPYLNLYTNTGYYYRAPNLFELFGDNGMTRGNDSLKAETVRQFDAGIRIHHELDNGRTWFFEFGHFINKTSNTIIFINRYSQSRAMNIEGAVCTGIESSHRFPVNRLLSLEGNETCQITENHSGLYGTGTYYGNQLPLEPGIDMTEEIILRLIDPLEIRYRFRYQGSNFVDEANMTRLEARSIHSVQTMWRLMSGLKIHFFGDNLTDQVYWNIYGIPKPGRSFGIGINYERTF